MGLDRRTWGLDRRTWGLEQENLVKKLKDVEISVPIVYGNVAFWLGKKASEYQSHKWTVYVRGATNEDLSVVVKRVSTEDADKRKRIDPKDNPLTQWFTDFSKADELLKLAAARQQREDRCIRRTYQWDPMRRVGGGGFLSFIVSHC
ncbi:hypothetical protein QVD17_34828 [Tagetes erecta]|uniref:YEATS domain-containing protein n=1 Tax=Tagetes erecta TaxID=13708 RepID=A0AAD8K2H4_TARER|nr:hypothetical protein QVD17_34828 [Tagetes erecta]